MDTVLRSVFKLSYEYVILLHVYRKKNVCYMNHVIKGFLCTFMQLLTHFSLESPKREIGKQSDRLDCRMGSLIRVSTVCVLFTHFSLEISNADGLITKNWNSTLPVYSVWLRMCVCVSVHICLCAFVGRGGFILSKVGQYILSQGWLISPPYYLWNCL